MKDFIELFYVEKNQTYSGTIERSGFLIQMQHLAKWFPTNNQNATKLCTLIPEIESITINKDIIDTQDVPFIEYKIPGKETTILKILRTHHIVWGFLQNYCDEAKAKSK